MVVKRSRQPRTTLPWGQAPITIKCRDIDGVGRAIAIIPTSHIEIAVRTSDGETIERDRQFASQLPGTQPIAIDCRLIDHALGLFAIPAANHVDSPVKIDPIMQIQCQRIGRHGKPTPNRAIGIKQTTPDLIARPPPIPATNHIQGIFGNDGGVQIERHRQLADQIPGAKRSVSIDACTANGRERRGTNPFAADRIKEVTMRDDITQRQTLGQRCRSSPALNFDRGWHRPSPGHG